MKNKKKQKNKNKNYQKSLKLGNNLEYCNFYKI